MPVVAARVHCALVGGFVGETGDLGDRERIDVGSQPNAWTRVVNGCGDVGDDPGAGVGCLAPDVGDELDSQVGQLLLDDLRGAGFFELDLGVRVEVAPDRDNIIEDAGDLVVEVGGCHGHAQV